MENIHNWKSFNENVFKNAYNFIKLVKILRGWQKKYEPEDYDGVIAKAFDLIDSYDLKPGKLSPPFTLSNSQLKMAFIKKFMNAAEEHGYKIVSKPAEDDSTTFNFKR